MLHIIVLLIVFMGLTVGGMGSFYLVSTFVYSSIQIGDEIKTGILS